MDDVFSIVKRKSAKALLDHINELDAQIEFTMEREQEGILPFLNVAVRRSDTGILRTAVYREPTHTGRMLNFFSHHSRSARAAVVHALLGRIDSHFAEEDQEGKRLQKQQVFETLLANDCPRRFIEHIADRRNRRSRRDCIGLACDDVSQGEDR